uniref:CCHC-type domain-containing protein n=1 Tax=Chromera velia CCMP2878 TaxID=1169474 RepID=A0A0G4H9T4_9ALVE|eukprot:Cvel_25468.t1-p1 / transcript=Cvel_25468.t1 / gene=Cvel_25468 / organism=Chromera_velia_CCMP2878 / gene_product=Cellular nucleic acid-binding protein homolog, putative / transcript_product=Cellular nucleic acid-binding protein homolog, putative / location=Cvel_scaffold2890:15651-20549(-) / protein_length=1115 / sequence_SO=supercontig / SO=protein_coding / is_pseudo=false
MISVVDVAVSQPGDVLESPPVDGSEQNGLNQSEGTSSNGNTSRCYNCHETGHFSRDCPKPQMTMCYNCYQTGHRSYECTSGKRCHLCNMPDHLARQCPLSLSQTGDVVVPLSSSQSGGSTVDGSGSQSLSLTGGANGEGGCSSLSTTTTANVFGDENALSSASSNSPDREKAAGGEGEGAGAGGETSSDSSNVSSQGQQQLSVLQQDQSQQPQPQAAVGAFTSLTRKSLEALSLQERLDGGEGEKEKLVMALPNPKTKAGSEASAVRVAPAPRLQVETSGLSSEGDESQSSGSKEAGGEGEGTQKDQKDAQTGGASGTTGKKSKRKSQPPSASTSATRSPDSQSDETGGSEDNAEESSKDGSGQGGVTTSTQIRCYNCNQRGHYSKDCPQPKMEMCYNCGQRGHRTFKCPVGKTCHICGSRDHLARLCPQKESLETAATDSSQQQQQLQTSPVQPQSQNPTPTPTPTAVKQREDGVSVAPPKGIISLPATESAQTETEVRAEKTNLVEPVFPSPPHNNTNSAVHSLQQQHQCDTTAHGGLSFSGCPSGFPLQALPFLPQRSASSTLTTFERTLSGRMQPPPPPTGLDRDVSTISATAGPSHLRGLPSSIPIGPPTMISFPFLSREESANTHNAMLHQSGTHGGAPHFSPAAAAAGTPGNPLGFPLGAPAFSRDVSAHSTHTAAFVHNPTAAAACSLVSFGLPNPSSPSGPPMQPPPPVQAVQVAEGRPVRDHLHAVQTTAQTVIGVPLQFSHPVPVPPAFAPQNCPLPPIPGPAPELFRHQSYHHPPPPAGPPTSSPSAVPEAPPLLRLASQPQHFGATGPRNQHVRKAVQRVARAQQMSMVSIREEKEKEAAGNGGGVLGVTAAGTSTGRNRRNRKQARREREREEALAANSAAAEALTKGLIVTEGDGEESSTCVGGSSVAPGGTGIHGLALGLGGRKGPETEDDSEVPSPHPSMNGREGSSGQDSTDATGGEEADDDEDDRLSVLSDYPVGRLRLESIDQSFQSLEGPPSLVQMMRHRSGSFLDYPYQNQGGEYAERVGGSVPLGEATAAAAENEAEGEKESAGHQCSAGLQIPYSGGRSRLFSARLEMVEEFGEGVGSGDDEIEEPPLLIG